jgi:MFS family permease
MHPALQRPLKSALGAVFRAQGYAKSFPRPVWLLIAATFVESMGRFMVVPYLSLYMRDAGVSLGTLGFVLGAAPIANVAFGAWGGQLSDRWGRKPVQILGVSLSGLAMFGFALSGANPYVLGVLNFLNGMTRTFYRPATHAALADLCPADRRSEAYALNRIGLNAAFGFGPVLGVAIFQLAPKAGFIVGGVLNLLVGLYIALAVPESAPARTMARSRTPEGGRGPAARLKDGNAALREIARDSGFWIWIAGMTMVWGAYDLIQSFLPLHIRDGGVALWAYSAVLTTNALVCVFAQLPVSRALRTAPFAPAAGLSKLPFALGFLGFAFFRSPALLILSMLMLSLGEVWGSAVQVRYIPEHARPEFLGRYMGLSMVSELGRAVCAPAAGLLMGRFGGEAVFLMAAALSLGGGALLYLAGKAQDGGLQGDPPSYGGPPKTR